MKRFSVWLNEARTKKFSFAKLGKAADKIRKQQEKAEKQKQKEEQRKKEEADSLHAYAYPLGYKLRKKMYGTPMPKKYRPVRKSHLKTTFPDRADYEVARGPQVTPGGKDLTDIIFGDKDK